MTRVDAHAAVRSPHRIGVLGGTFDPVHVGHLSAAHAALAEFGLDEIRFAPVAQPWHKSARELASPTDRLAMLRLALADEDGLTVTTVDVDRGGDTYTIDTLADLRAQFAHEHPDASVEWYFITGADAIAQLASWRDPERLLEEATFLAVTRPGFDLTVPEVAGAERIRTLASPTPDVSSSDIRARVARSESIAGLVPPAVAHYIAEHGLYR